MIPEVRAELETLYGMVVAWKEEKVRYVTPAGGDEYLVGDLLEEIERDLYPYLRRMLECEYIAEEELGGFLDRCYGIVEELVAYIDGQVDNSRSADYSLM